MTSLQTNVAGFQGSETSSVEVVFYRQTGDLIGILSGVSGEVRYTVEGRNQDDPQYSIIGLQTTKTLSPEPGTWSVQLKPSLQAEDLFKALNDDDWVDISINRHGRKWHVMRGLVNDIRRSRSVAGSGATSTTYTISGQDFLKVPQRTPIWSDLYNISTESFGAFLPTTIFQTLKDTALRSGVAEFVRKSLEGYLQAANDTDGRTAWRMPAGMPGTTDFFITSLQFLFADYLNDPPRALPSQHWVSPDGDLWSWIVERSDPVMTELFGDVLPGAALTSSQGFQPESIADGLSVDESIMAIVVRDKPFPRTDTGRDGPWFQRLGTYIIPRQQIVSSDVGRTTQERFNAFFMSTIIYGHNQKGQDSIVMQTPSWNPGDIDRHGIRRFDLQTIWMPNYNVPSGLTGEKVGWAEFQSLYRNYLRDWHALNPYFLNGSISLAIGRPDLKVGQKLRIPGDIPAEDETYYIENVSHSWQYGQGTRTDIGVTRGWVGTDDSLLDALDFMRGDYETPEVKRATPETT